MECDIIQDHMRHYETRKSNIVQYKTIWDNIKQYETILDNIRQYNIRQVWEYPTIQYNTI